MARLAMALNNHLGGEVSVQPDCCRTRYHLMSDILGHLQLLSSARVMVGRPSFVAHLVGCWQTWVNVVDRHSS